MAGIIGGMLAGAAQGAGEAGVAVGRQWMVEDAAARLKQMEAEIQQARDARLFEHQDTAQERGITATRENLETTEAGAKARLGISEAGAEKRLGISETGATARQNAGFTHTEEMARVRSAFESEQNKLNRELTKEQIASHERIAGANNATARELAKIGGTIGQDKDGNVLFYGKDGTAKPIMDPNSPNTPLKGYKDLTPAAKAYVDVIKDQLGKLMTQETAVAAAGGDQAALTKITQQRAALNADLLNVITGGLTNAGKGKDDGNAIKDPFKSGEPGKAAAKAETKPGIIEDATKASGTATQEKQKAQPKQTSESTKAYETAMENSFLTKVAQRVGAGTVDFATAVGKLGWDWDHFHATGGKELKRKYETQGMTPVGSSLD